MKRIAMAGLLAFAFGHMAFATVTLQLISGATDVTIADGSGGDTNSLANVVGYTNGNLNGWDVTITVGKTNSPSNSPYGLDLTSLTATCNLSDPGCTGAVLEIEVSDTGFHGPSSLINGYSSTIVNGGHGATAQIAYYSNGNGLFATTTEVCEVGPLSSTGSGTCSGGGTTGATYSETLVQYFSAAYCSDCSPSAVSFSSDGDITATPEPASVMLLGTAVLFGAAAIRRRKSGKV